MGGLVSRRKRAKVEARSVSTQATENKTESQAAECRAEEATDVYEPRKTALTELNIGDGLLPTSQLRQHDFPFKRRTSTENKKRRGLSFVKVRPRSGKKGHTIGVDFSTQYDFPGLPGQVSPSFRNSLTKGNIKEKIAHSDPDVRTRVNLQRLESAAKQEVPIVKPQHHTPPTSPCRPNTDVEHKITSQGYSPLQQETTDDREEQEDENSNIIKEGTLLADLRNQELYGCCTDDNLSPTIEQRVSNDPKLSPPVLTADASCGHSPGDRSPARKPRKKMVTYSDGCKPTEESLQPLSEVGRELHLSLEEIFQSNVPCHAELMEVAAVTGTGSAREALPPPAGYPACWNNEPLVSGGGGNYSHASEKTDAVAATQDYTDSGTKPGEAQATTAAPSADRQKGEPREDEDNDNDGCEGDDIAEDTLDWNVDDRVRSPSDSRTESSDSSDNDDDNNVDLLTDCTIDVVATSTGQRQSSLTTLKDGDSAGGSIYSPPPQSSPAKVHESNKSCTTANILTDALEQTQGLHDPNPMAQPTSPTPQTASSALANTDSKDNTGCTEDPPEDSSRAKTPPVQEKVALGKTGKFLLNLDDKTVSIGGEQKSLLAVQEAEAMTLLLLTGTLPGEDGGGVIRGAGDGQNLDVANDAGEDVDETREAGERAGLASMLDTQSKSSCQLEQLQLEQVNADQVENIALPNVQTLQNNEEDTQDDSSAAGAPVAIDQPDDRIQNNVHANHEADGSSAQERAPIIAGCDTSGGAAASCLVGERVEDKIPSPQRTDSGAASSEGDWEIIPLHRVLGQTDLGGSAASAPSIPPDLEDVYVQPRAAVTDVQEEAGSSTMPEGQATTTDSSNRQPLQVEPLDQLEATTEPLPTETSEKSGQPQVPSSSQDRLNLNETNERKTDDDNPQVQKTAAANEKPTGKAEKVGSPKPKRPESPKRTQTTLERGVDKNQSASNSTTAARSKSTPKTRHPSGIDGPAKTGSDKRKRDGETIKKKTTYRPSK